MAMENQPIDLTPKDYAAAKRYALVVEWSDEDRKYIATAPDVFGCRAHGATRAEAAEAGELAIALMLAVRTRNGVRAPEPAFSVLDQPFPLPREERFLLDEYGSAPSHAMQPCGIARTYVLFVQLPAVRLACCRPLSTDGLSAKNSPTEPTINGSGATATAGSFSG
jgi:predicted RNase H-like HicB family nuclease